MYETTILGNFGEPIEINKGKNGSKEYRYNCPYCEVNRGDPDTKGHFSVNSKTGFFHCYRCGQSGKLKLDNSIAIYTIDENVTIENNEILDIINDILIKPDSDFDKIIPLKKAINDKYSKDYLNKRGFTDEMIDFYDIRVGQINTPLLGYVVIPNETRELIKTDMYCARTFTGAGKRYLNPTESKSSRSVFNLHRIKENPDRIIVCEGALNAMAAGTNAVALYGKECSNTKLNMILAKHPKEIVVNLDLDAKNKAYELADRIKAISPEIQVRVYLIDELNIKDAADYLKHNKMDRYYENLEATPIYDTILNILNEMFNK